MRGISWHIHPARTAKRMPLSPPRPTLFAASLPLGRLEAEVLDRLPRRSVKVVVYGADDDTRAAVRRLREIGYTDVTILDGSSSRQKLEKDVFRRDHPVGGVVDWLTGAGTSASVFRYPVNVRHPAPLLAVRAEIRRFRAQGAARIGLMGFSAGGHLAELAALTPGAAPEETVQFAVLGYAITSMETDTYRPSRLILLGQDASPELPRATSLDALITPGSPPFFCWHTAEDTLSFLPNTPIASPGRWPPAGVPHEVHVFAHGPHSLGLARGAHGAAIWTTLAAAWIRAGNQRG
jgi:hypothetical protein